MVRALITGGAGFIGSHLSEKLLQAGYHVTIIDDLSTGQFENIAPLTAHKNFEFAIEDIANRNVMDRLVSECDVIYHLAAAVGVNLIVSSPIRVIETNVAGTEVVLQTASRYRKKVLIASTSEIYGKSTKTPFSEEDDRILGPTVKSRWVYSTSKALDEYLALAYHKEVGLPVILFRLFNTVGPRQRGQYGMVIPRFVTWAMKGMPLKVYGDGLQTRSFANVGDVVEAIKLLSESDAAIGEVFNVGSTEEISILDLAKRVIERTDSPSELEIIPYDQAYEAGFEDTRRRLPDTSKIQQTIGWSPQKDLNQTLDEIVAYFREHGMTLDF